MSRNIRTASTLGRRFFRSPGAINRRNGPVQVQHVRIVKPVFTPRRVQKIALWTTALGYVYYRLDQLDREEAEAAEREERERDESRRGQVKDAVQHVRSAAGEEKLGADGGAAAAAEVDEQGQQVAGAEVEGEEDDEDDIVPEQMPDDAWFIPLGWATQGPQTFYRGEDPEWQSFIEFSRDQNRGMVVRNELAGIVGRHLAGTSSFQKFLGTPITTGKYWLDVDFPEGPPPIWERMGLEVTDDYIALTRRPVDPINVSRLQGALWPSATGTSLWASCALLWNLQVAKVKKALNIEEDDDDRGMSYGHSDISQVFGGQQDKNAGDSSKNPGVTPTIQPSDRSNGNRPWIFGALPSVPQPNNDMSQASKVFRHSLAKNWKQHSGPPPRGTLLVSGLVEVYGPKGIATLDVRAAYNPAESHWVTVGIGVRRVQQRKQRPKG